MNLSKITMKYDGLVVFIRHDYAEIQVDGNLEGYQKKCEVGGSSGVS
jgi:hypothetical protein